MEPEVTLLLFSIPWKKQILFCLSLQQVWEKNPFIQPLAVNIPFPSGIRPLFPIPRRSHFLILMFYTHISDTMRTPPTPKATGHSFIVNQKCHPWQPTALKHLFSFTLLALRIISFMPDSQITIWQVSLEPLDHQCQLTTYFQLIWHRMYSCQSKNGKCK